MRILRRGDTGSDVKVAQTALTRAGYDPGPIDGVFGAKTESAVIQFQSTVGVTQDGVIGPATWAYLEPFAMEPNPEVLRIGSRGEMVRALQTALKASGNDPGAIDGIFGQKTKAALEAFQKKAGIPVTGVADAITWLSIAPYLDYTNVVLRRGSTGMYVMILQSALINACFNPGVIDGIFGTKTQAAVVAFQKANNLTADGIVGPKTWAALKPYITGKVVPYTVKAGDTLSSIAAAYHTTVSDILKLNPRENPNLIYPGEVFYIPVNSCSTNLGTGGT
ncbi:MAG TPA: peptidoglycan-binding protein [Clostridia bacterium]|nr:peptidoglycan-binding protein [Clostridia bacterium]